MTLGVSFTITGIFATSFTHDVIISVYSGTWPTAEPMPRSLMPCGQPKFSSSASAPASCGAVHHLVPGLALRFDHQRDDDELFRDSAF